MIIAIIILAVALVAALVWAMTVKQTCVRLEERNNQANAEAERIRAEGVSELQRVRTEGEAAISRIRQLCDAEVNRTKADMQREVSRIQADADKREAEYRERLDQRDKAEAEMEKRFKAIASEVLNLQSANMREQQESRLGLILKPLQEELNGFKKSITDNYNEESRQRFSLTEHIKRLIETNNSIGTEAKELARALRGSSKVQGDWGEMILESILDKSGLRRGEEYEVQATTDTEGNTLTNEEGARLRPDVVLHYPNQGDVIIDSKVSLKDYADYVNADDEMARIAAIDKHVKSVRKHIRELRDKRYQDYVGARTDTRTMDFVMMFVPNEGAYMSALHADPGLWQEGLESRVLIVSPTHLVSVLSMIRQMWNENRQNRNAIEIAEAAGRMYDKFCGFVTDMEKLKKGIENIDKTYTDAMGKLCQGRGNLIRRAEELKNLGAKATKQLSKTADDDQSDKPLLNE